SWCSNFPYIFVWTAPCRQGLKDGFVLLTYQQAYDSATSSAIVLISIYHCSAGIRTRSDQDRKIKVQRRRGLVRKQDGASQSDRVLQPGTGYESRSGRGYRRGVQP